MCVHTVGVQLLGAEHHGCTGGCVHTGAAPAVKGQYPCVCTLWVCNYGPVSMCMHIVGVQGVALAVKGQYPCVHTVGVQEDALAIMGQYPCVCTLWVYMGLHLPLRASIHVCELWGTGGCTGR